MVVFDAVTGKSVARVRGHAHVVRAVAISVDGKLLASSGGDGHLAVWDIAKGERLWLSDSEMGGDSVTFVGKSATLAADEGMPRNSTG